MSREMSEIIGSIPTIEFIEGTLVSPKGNGVKVSEATSQLIAYTGNVCDTCLAGEKNSGGYPLHITVDCLSLKSPKKGTGNSPLNLCTHYE